MAKYNFQEPERLLSEAIIDLDLFRKKAASYRVKKTEDESGKTKKFLDKTEQKNCAVDWQIITFFQKQLASYIGPIARLVIKDILSENAAITWEQLIETLAAEIPDSKSAQEFRRKLIEDISQIKTTNDPVSAKEIELCQRELASYIGPIARLIIEDILSENVVITGKQLIESLAAEIPDSKLAQEFKQNLENKIEI